MAASIHRGVNAKGRNARTQSFAGVPRAVMKHHDYINLPACAKVLLFELAYQFTGFNNGDLQIAWSLMKERGFNSPATLNKAKKALLGANLIVCTRVGQFMNPGGLCSLFALTWREIHECRGKLDVQPTTVALRKF